MGILLFLLGGFINNRKTSSGAIVFTGILYSSFKYSKESTSFFLIHRAQS